MLLAVLLAAQAGEGGEVAALERLWSGVRDSSEQVVMSSEPGDIAWPQQSERRVRTVVAHVNVPWLGAHVLYLEEFLEDEAEHPRRQLLLQLESARAEAHAVHVQVFGFVQPAHWTHLNFRPQLAGALVWSDLTSAPGCDFILTRAADQFRGGTRGDQCRDRSSASPRYLDYQLVISEELYWYRSRAFREIDGQLQQEIIGFNRFEPNEARLYSCRIAWSAGGTQRELRPLTNLELSEAGGHAHFATPDGRSFQLTLHGRDWPFAPDRDALILLLQEDGHEQPLATAWAQMDTQKVALQLGWLEVRCGSLAPDSDELTQ
jgi:hypothetical protein